MQEFDALILGAGGAGLFCAARLGARGRRVAVLDHAPSPGRKILISGGGRCNFTNLASGPDRFQSNNPHFCRSALARFSPSEFVELVRKHGIEFYEKKDGQLFCSDSARRILEMLLAACEASGVARVDSCAISKVAPISSPESEGFCVETARGEFSAPALVVATGGLSIPKIGASGFGYEIARQFGHNIVPPEPALVPFVMDAAWQSQFAGLSGLSCDVRVATKRKSFSEAMLFTHRGLSGPAILQASLYWREGETIVIDFLPGLETKEWMRQCRAEHGEKTVAGALALLLPKRLATALVGAAWNARSVRSLSDAEWETLMAQLRRKTATPAGTEGFEKAEVTRGGVDTKEISSKTMESVKRPGLYFIGEVLDVTGELGGHNFQWAWASAAAAAAGISQALENEEPSR